MADTLTLQIQAETTAKLQRIAAETGESVEDVALRLVEEGAAFNDDLGLDEEQLAELDRRLDNPGPYASPERVERVLSRFRPNGP